MTIFIGVNFIQGECDLWMETWIPMEISLDLVCFNFYSISWAHIEPFYLNFLPYRWMDIWQFLSRAELINQGDAFENLNLAHFLLNYQFFILFSYLLLLSLFLYILYTLNFLVFSTFHFLIYSFFTFEVNWNLKKNIYISCNYHWHMCWYYPLTRIKINPLDGGSIHFETSQLQIQMR